MYDFINLLQSRKEHKIFNYISTFLFFLILISILIFPYSIGMADNEDFGRTMNGLGISHLLVDRNEIFLNYLRLEYSNLGEHYIPRSLSQLIAYISLYVNNLFNSEGVYNILYLGLLYISFYTLISYIFISKIINRLQTPLYIKVFLLIISFLLLLDGMFIFYFNSFYQESISIIAIFLFVVYGSKNNMSPIVLLWILLLIIISKSQNVIFVLMVPLIIYLYKDAISKRLVLFFIILFTLSSIYTSIISKPYREPNIYNSFFYGLLKNTDESTSTEIMKSFNLDFNKHCMYIDKGYWPAGVEFRKEQPFLYQDFYKKVSHFSIIKIYFSHPKILINNIYFGLKYLTNNPAKISYLGNLQKVESINNKRTSIDTILGNILNKTFILIYAFSIFLSIFILRKKLINTSNAEKNILLLTFIIPFIFGINILGDGFYEFTKHNLSFYYALNLLLLSTVVYTVNSLYLKIEKRH